MIFTVNPILIAAAVIPAIFLLVRVERADRLEKESRGLLLSLVLFGVVATALASLGERIGIAILSAMLPEGTLFNFLLYFGVVAFAEEGAKYILLKRKTWNHPEFNCQFDGVVYSVFVSLGFALWENIGYVAREGAGDPYGAANLRRHALLVPALLHGFYDFTATFENVHMGWIFTVFVIAMFITASRLVKRMAANDTYIDRNRFGLWL